MTMGCSQFCKEDMARRNVIYNDILLYMSDFPRPFELFWPTKGSENRTTANRGGVGVFTVSFRVLWSWYTVCYITFGTMRGEWVACLPNHVCSSLLHAMLSPPINNQQPADKHRRVICFHSASPSPPFALSTHLFMSLFCREAVTEMHSGTWVRSKLPRYVPWQKTPENAFCLFSGQKPLFSSDNVFDLQRWLK